MELSKGFRKSGTFTIGSDANLLGDLSLNGDRTFLELHSPQFFKTQPGSAILGSLHDTTKVSLIDCITLQDGRTVSNGGQYYFASVFPHLVLLGLQHIAPDDNKIASVSFEVSDGHVLFHDTRAFGAVMHDTTTREAIAQFRRSKGEEIVWGDVAQVFYFTGQFDILRAETDIGIVSVRHAPTIESPGIRGFKVQNNIRVEVAFGSAETIAGAMETVGTLLRFFSIMAGRTQHPTRIRVRTSATGPSMSALDVYWSLHSDRIEGADAGTPLAGDIPIQVARDRRMFATVLTNWLAKNADWRNARDQFFSGFHKQGYSIDRLVGAANMFDILPKTAAPPDVALSSELAAARESAKKLFKPLVNSPERNSILGSLGRMERASLKHKVRARAKPVIERAGQSFPDLITVLDEAVNCRNFYVHGTESKIDYSKNTDQIIFLTEALEFVFATSDLVDCGWNIAAWSQKFSSVSHPFDRFLKGYGSMLDGLKKALAEGKVSAPEPD